MELIRTSSVIDGSEDLETLQHLKDFPVFMGCVDHSRDQDLFADQIWDICRKTGVIQLQRLIPLDVLYQAQHAGAVGAIWMQHHAEFAGFLHRFSPHQVLEIGGAHGILSIEYSNLAKISWTILEPNPAPVTGCEAKFIRGFFGTDFEYEETFDTLVHSHVFEHIYEPARFVEKLSSFMPPGKKLVFSVPNMKEMLARKYTNGINFEHSVFLAEEYIEFLLARNGFRLLEKQYFLPDHSIFYAAVRDSNVPPYELPGDLYQRNKNSFNEYVQYHIDLVQDLNHQINSTTSPIYLFGAHVFSQYLIACGLDIERVVCLLDNDGNKQGHRLYGTPLSVESPRILQTVDSPLVILKAGVYNDEIKEDILKNYNSNTQFI